jgi:hypothetical protein
MMYIVDKYHRIMMKVVERRYKEDSKQMWSIQRTWNMQNSVIQCFNFCIITPLNNFSSRGKILCLPNTKTKTGRYHSERWITHLHKHSVGGIISLIYSPALQVSVMRRALGLKDCVLFALRALATSPGLIRVMGWPGPFIHTVLIWKDFNMGTRQVKYFCFIKGH